MLDHLSERRIKNAIQPRIDAMVKDVVEAEVATQCGPVTEALARKIDGRISRLSERLSERLDEHEDDEDDEGNSPWAWSYRNSNDGCRSDFGNRARR